MSDHLDNAMRVMADQSRQIERLRAENEVLREIERDVSNAMPGVYYMNPEPRR